MTATTGWSCAPARGPSTARPSTSQALPVSASVMSGVPIYKSDWSDANSVESAIQYFLDVSDRRRSRERLAPFRVERLDYRNQNREAFFQGLERSGPKAVQEFRDAFGG